MRHFQELKFEERNALYSELIRLKIGLKKAFIINVVVFEIVRWP